MELLHRTRPFIVSGWRLVLASVAGVVLGCSTTYYDAEDGEGLVDDRGRSVAVEEAPKPGDLEFESESNAEINEEESIQDAVDASDR